MPLGADTRWAALGLRLRRPSKVRKIPKCLILMVF
jgi:hypothetical protein